MFLTGKWEWKAQTETVWRQANKYKVPRVCFINKINQTGGDFQKSLKTIHQHLSKKAYPVHLPIGFEQKVSGLVDLISMKAYVYDDYTDKELQEIPIPADLLKEAEQLRHQLIEQAVVEDEDILVKYLEEGEESLTVDDLKQAVRSATLSGEFYPVSGGDGRGVIVEKLLDLMVDFLPSPADTVAIEGFKPKNL